jgi:nucleoside-diphosphate-sugar epimerase
VSLVAVTGAGGFIGSHVVERLLEDGHDVRALARYASTGAIGFLPSALERWPQRLRVLRGSVDDPRSMRELVDGSDAVIHLAAVVGIPHSYTAPHQHVLTNVVGTLNLLEAAREAGTGRVVHVSTCEVYGGGPEPLGEDHPLSARSPYAATKAGGEQLALSYHRAFDLPVVILRPFNAFGPRQSPRAFIPAVIAQALTGPVVRLGRLEPRRDLTYVADTARGIALAALTPGIEGLSINLGSGRSRTVEEVAGAVLARVNPDARIARDEQRVRPEAAEVMQLLADTARAERLLGYRPAIGFDRGLDLTIADVRAHLERQRPAEYAR